MGSQHLVPGAEYFCLASSVKFTLLYL